MVFGYNYCFQSSEISSHNEVASMMQLNFLRLTKASCVGSPTGVGSWAPLQQWLFFAAWWQTVFDGRPLFGPKAQNNRQLNRNAFIMSFETKIKNK